MKRPLMTAFALLAAGALTTGCAASGSSSSGSGGSGGSVEIGVASTLSGPFGSYGQAGLNAIKLAVQDLNKSGGVLRADNNSDASFIGSELDLLLTWQLDRHTLFYLGYSHVFPGDFIQRTGPAQDIDLLYAAATFTF